MPVRTYHHENLHSTKSRTFSIVTARRRIHQALKKLFQPSGNER